MSGQLRSELFKQRTTRTNAVLLVSMVSLIALVVVLHMVTLPAHDFSDRQGQLKILGLGTTFGMVFASLLGAIAVTGEIRHGLIRPTFLVTPKRGRVIAAKVAASAIAGAAFGLLAEVLAVAVGGAALAGRGIHLSVSGADVAQLLAGGAVAAAVWAVIGVGVGAIVRNLVGAVVGLVVWQLFVEMTLIGSLPSVGKFAPGAGAGAMAGAILEQTSTYLLSPALGALVVAGYAAATTAAAVVTTARRDVG
ncbi:MAG: ABC transporter permease [Candidatus Dormibacteraeota bacterium]|nr:ABC transporter permease [Candidatus Dormibacteraeota bacterium]